MQGVKWNGDQGSGEQPHHVLPVEIPVVSSLRDRSAGEKRKEWRLDRGKAPGLIHAVQVDLRGFDVRARVELVTRVHIALGLDVVLVPVHENGRGRHLVGLRRWFFVLQMGVARVGD